MSFYYKAQRYDNKKWEDLPVNIFATGNVKEDPNGNGYIYIPTNTTYQNIILASNAGVINIDNQNINVGGGGTGSPQTALIVENGELRIEQVGNPIFKEDVLTNKYYLPNTTSIKNWSLVVAMYVNGIAYFKGFHWNYDKDKDRIYWLNNNISIHELEDMELFFIYQIEPKNIININPTITEPTTTP